jgi:hypothetical protein
LGVAVVAFVVGVGVVVTAGPSATDNGEDN